MHCFSCSFIQKTTITKTFHLTCYFTDQHLPEIYFCYKKKFKVLTFKRLSVKYHKCTTSYLKINGIMCCIVLKYFYLCDVREEMVPELMIP